MPFEKRQERKKEGVVNVNCCVLIRVEVPESENTLISTIPTVEMLSGGRTSRQTEGSDAANQPITRRGEKKSVADF